MGKIAEKPIATTTCIDCGALIIWDHLGPRLCCDCAKWRVENNVRLNDAQPYRLNRLVVCVEFTWDPSVEDLAYIHEGDQEVDFARRSLERMRPMLERIIGATEDKFDHYYLVNRPGHFTKTQERTENHGQSQNTEPCCKNQI